MFIFILLILLPHTFNGHSIVLRHAKNSLAMTFEFAFVSKLLCYYTGPHLSRLVWLTRGRGPYRKSRDEIRGRIKEALRSRDLCLICGGIKPDVHMFCCQYRNFRCFIHFQCLKIRLDILHFYQCPRCQYLYTDDLADNIYFAYRHPSYSNFQADGTPYTALFRRYVATYHPHALPRLIVGLHV